MIILRCCVIDDEPLARDLIASYVDKTPFMELVGKFSSAQEAIKEMCIRDRDVPKRAKSPLRQLVWNAAT